MGVHQKLFAQQKLWRLYLIALNSNIYIKFQFVCFFPRFFFSHVPLCEDTNGRERTMNFFLFFFPFTFEEISKRNPLSSLFLYMFGAFFASATPWNWPFLSRSLHYYIHLRVGCSPNFLVSLHIDSFFAWSQDSWLIYINLSFYIGLFVYDDCNDAFHLHTFGCGHKNHCRKRKNSAFE